MNTTTLNRLISEVDLNNISNQCTPDWEGLASVFNIHFLNWSNDTRLKTYFIKKWYCTDSYVGIRVYFLDGKPAALSNQSGRKSSEDFTFISKEIALEVNAYLMSLVVEEQDFTVEVFEEGELDEEIADLFQIEYNSQILHKTAFLDNEKVKIIKTNFGNFAEGNTEDYFHSVQVEKQDGTKIKTSVKNLWFEYNK